MIKKSQEVKRKFEGIDFLSLSILIIPGIGFLSLFGSCRKSFESYLLNYYTMLFVGIICTTISILSMVMLIIKWKKFKEAKRKAFLTSDIIITDRIRQYSGFLKIDTLIVENKNGKVVHREVINRGNAVAGLIYDTKKHKYILIKQWRPGPEHSLVEIVAGTMDKEGEKPEECMSREVMEEIGYKVDKIQSLHSCYGSPGSLSEMVHIFYVEVSEKTGTGGGVGDEELEMIEVSEDGLHEQLVNDAKTIIAIQWLKNRNMQKQLLSHK